VELRSPLNLIHNTQLESIHYALGTTGSSQLAADMFSSISPNRITTVGFDITHAVLRYVAEQQQLKRLGMILSSQNFSGLSRILVRLEYDWDYSRRRLSDMAFESTMDYSLSVIYDAFQSARARGILEVEHLEDKRRHFKRDMIDDCFSTEIPADAAG
jgi:hypothetical protein